MSPTPGTATESIRAMAERYGPRLRPGQFFCETTALALHGLPIPGREPVDRIHVGVLPPGTPPRTRGVVGHQYGVSRVYGVLPVCPPIEAWVQSARRLPLDDLVMIGDGLVRRKSPFCSTSDLQAAIAASRGGRGAVRLAEAWQLVRAGTDSPMETLWRLLIVRSGLPEPLVNAPVTDARGVRLGFGDLVFPLWKVVVEYEGGYHFETAEQVHHDIERLASFVEAAWTVIRVDKKHFRNPGLILRRIRAALEAAGWRD